MHARRVLKNLCSLAVLGGLSLATASAFGAITPEQVQEIRGISAALTKVTTLLGQDEFQKSADGLKEVQERIEKLAESRDEEVLRALNKVYEKLAQDHALLEIEGWELAPLKELPTASSTPGSNSSGPSFVRDVVPMLLAKCGNCHVTGSRGNFSMANYVALMRGSQAGVVIFPGEPVGSRLVELIESGDMPRGGGQVTPQELQALKAWIAAGAKFDGQDPQANLASLAAPGTTPTTPMPAAGPPVTAPSGTETIRFSLDIAPVLAQNCNGCHVNPQNARGNLNFTNFQGLLQGGDSGTPIVAGKPAESLLIRRIKGEGGEARMPMNRPPLSDEVIAKFEKWIAEGATYDGPTPTMDITQVAALAKARNSTHEELSADRAALAMQNWLLGMAGAKNDKYETKNFLLLGNVGANTLEEYGQRAEELAPLIARTFGAPANQPLIKGRMTLYLFNQRYDYSEFGQMVEKRELPREWRGHWNYTIVDAYGAMMPPRDGSYSLEGLIAQQLAGTYVASLNNPPRWFSEGCARVAASQAAPRDPRVVAWKEMVPSAMAAMTRPDDFLTGKLTPEESDVAAFSFVSGLMKDSRRFGAVLNGLRKGEAFEATFVAAYGAKPEQVAELWARSGGRVR